MLNYSAKEIANVESKNENESGMQDKSQKCKNFIDANNIIMAHININFLRNKFDMLANTVTEYIDIKSIQNGLADFNYFLL